MVSQEAPIKRVSCQFNNIIQNKNENKGKNYLKLYNIFSNTTCLYVYTNLLI